eukprot:1195244-Prorocentrum_minimum.AAC.6
MPYIVSVQYAIGGIPSAIGSHQVPRLHSIKECSMYLGVPIMDRLPFLDPIPVKYTVKSRLTTDYAENDDPYGECDYDDDCYFYDDHHDFACDWS